MLDDVYVGMWYRLKLNISNFEIWDSLEVVKNRWLEGFPFGRIC